MERQIATKAGFVSVLCTPSTLQVRMHSTFAGMTWQQELTPEEARTLAKVLLDEASIRERGMKERGEIL